MTKGSVGRESDLLRATLENMAQGVAMYDADHRLVTWNDRFRQYLEMPAEFLGTDRTFSDYIRYLGERGEFGDADIETELAKRLALLDQSHSFERVRPDGTVLEVRRDPVPGGGFIAIYTDITERKKSELQLRNAKDAAESASRIKSSFLANMSHELRTPLNAIIGYSEILLEDAIDRGDTPSIADLEKIQGAGKHLLGLINDILDLSKIEAGRMDVYLEPVFLTRLIDEVKTIVDPMMKKNGNQFVVECPGDIGALRTDQTKLKQSLINLLSNAAKFTKQGTVTLRLSRLEGDERPRIRFEIADSGIGMTPDQMSRLFQAFTQADSSTTRNFGGTGLGLTITKHFCAMLGGSIDVRSTPNEGSVFTIELPIQNAEAGSADSADDDWAEADGELPADAMTVLVVDDDAVVHDVLASTLDKRGYRLMHARNGMEALELMRTTPPDIVTLDVMMPKIDGWSVLGIMKSDPQLAHIPVIMLTIVDDKNLGFSLGASEYMTKPIDRNRLIALLRKFVPTDRQNSVLVVDDNADVRGLLKSTIEGVGMKAAEAIDGVTALDWLNKNGRPSLVLLDLIMPTMDGFAFLQKVRDMPHLAGLPIVVLTAKDLTESERAFLAENTLLVLSKSAQPIGALGQALARIVGRRQGAQAAAS
ncbi:response regulator [Pseudolabrys taiwanensis]|uniref:histidine kinase n=1 Tax=Pseudolabrys taiwanensis TaxID=331696 RepID=A0A346A4S4_9HYPH|nr:response regulator [Pseudolabrys taiwanensis]AXK84171.1 response regulator [Pseudolabrys taiwanensis]